MSALLIMILQPMRRKSALPFDMDQITASFNGSAILSQLMHIAKLLKLSVKIFHESPPPLTLKNFLATESVILICYYFSLRRNGVTTSDHVDTLMIIQDGRLNSFLDIILNKEFYKKERIGLQIGFGVVCLKNSFS